MTRDPWRVLVSEFVCQQTQAARAVEGYERVTTRFPTPKHCAESNLSDVLEAWAGLGYYRRARDLHRCAKLLCDRHDGQVPDSLEALLELPGVGAYTARAVLAFAFESDVAVLDTNVGRVLARALSDRPLRPAEAQRLADALVPKGDAWRHNQAILDLGALHCRPTPRCETCPISARCRWHALGGPDPAQGSAGVTKPQSRFEGSDRQGRARLLASIVASPVSLAELDLACGWPGETKRARRIAEGLVSDDMAVIDGDQLRVRV